MGFVKLWLVCPLITPFLDLCEPGQPSCSSRLIFVIKSIHDVT